MKKMRKLVSLVCALVMVLVWAAPAGAAEPAISETSIPAQSDEAVSTSRFSLDNIPIYFDFCREQDTYQVEACNTNTNVESDIVESVELTLDEKNMLIEKEIFSETLSRAQDMIEAGNRIRGIHFLLPTYEGTTPESASSVLAADDWRKYTILMGTYRGYEFRYIDTFIDGDTGYIKVEDIGKVNWDELVKEGLLAVVPGYLGKVGAAFEILITLNTLIDAAAVNPKVTYTYSAQNYIKYNALFRHHHRSFWMSDNEDRVYGVDYYLPGAAERVEVDNHILSRHPLLNGGWESSSGQTNRVVITTPGYYGGSTIYEEFIQSYYSADSAGYYENIDLRATLIDIMLNTKR